MTTTFESRRVNGVGGVISWSDIVWVLSLDVVVRTDRWFSKTTGDVKITPQ